LRGGEKVDKEQEQRKFEGRDRGKERESWSKDGMSSESLAVMEGEGLGSFT
jgi:hypothetical protein